MDIHLFGKKVGTYKASTKTYVCFRTRQKHYFQKYKGYGLSNSLIEKLQRMNCQKVIIIEELADKTQRKLTTTLQAFIQKGHSHTDKKADHQKILEETEFQMDKER